MSDWTIYNNTKKWKRLSEDLKGAFLLANHYGEEVSVDVNGVLAYCGSPAWNEDCVYRAVKMKPEMWEEMQIDHHECQIDPSLYSEAGVFKRMIAMGWVKL